MSDLVSVIVPIYNVEQYLERCIKSIQNQTYENLEIILVDDGSPDNCGEICDRYAKEDSRIKVIHKANGGLSDARNVGLKVASGEYVLLIDSDDWIHNQTVEILTSLSAKYKTDISMCSYMYVYEGKEYTDEKKDLSGILDKAEVVSQYNAQEIYFTNPDKRLIYTVAWNKLYKRKLFDNIEYPKGKVHEDEYTTFKLLHEVDNIAVSDEVLCYYFVRSDSIMGTFKPSRFDAFDAYLEKMDCYNKWQYKELEKKALFHAIHMFLQYQKWAKDDNVEVKGLLRKYKAAICKTARRNMNNMTVKDKMEYILYKYFYFVYYGMWKIKRG